MARAGGEDVKRCRCGERNRAKTGVGETGVGGVSLWCEIIDVKVDAHRLWKTLCPGCAKVIEDHNRIVALVRNITGGCCLP